MASTRKLVLALLLGLGTWASPRARTRVRPSRPAESVDNAAERAGEALEDAGEKVQREAE